MKPDAIVVIGASAGAIEALTAILPALPAGLAASVAIVVHMGPQDPGLLPTLFRTRAAMRVLEAEDKEPLAKGAIYFAPVDYHLMIETDLTFSLSCDDLVHYSRPSIDVLFESASCLSGAVLAVVLSGGNSDGAHGAAEIARRGGTVFVQSLDTAFCSAMPKAAIESCPAAMIFPLQELAFRIVRWVEDRSAAC